MKRKIVLHRSAKGASVHINRGARGHRDINVAGVIVEGVLAAGAEVAVIRNISGGGAYADALGLHILETDGAARRQNLNVTTIDGLEIYRAANGDDMQVRVLEIADVNLGSV